MMGKKNTDAIARMVNRIVERFDPEQIILFGSYAYGKPTPDFNAVSHAIRYSSSVGR